VTLALGMPVGLARAQAPVTAPYCGLHWGSGFKTGGTYYSVPGEGVSNVRAGRHACFDRLVVDLNRPNDFYDVSYVPGTPVPFAGRRDSGHRGRSKCAGRKRATQLPPGQPDRPCRCQRSAHVPSGRPGEAMD
jgi:hypothetical protein